MRINPTIQVLAAVVAIAAFIMLAKPHTSTAQAAEPTPAAFCFKCQRNMYTNHVTDRGIKELGGFARTNMSIYTCPVCKEALTNITQTWMPDDQFHKLFKPVPFPGGGHHDESVKTNEPLLLVNRRLPMMMDTGTVYVVEWSTNLTDWVAVEQKQPKFFRLIEISSGPR